MYMAHEQFLLAGEGERERAKLIGQNTNARENHWCTRNAAYKYTNRTCAHIQIMF